MYKKSPQGWLKHWDFILLDIFCLQLAFVVAYLVRQGLENPYSDQIYRTVAFVFYAVPDRGHVSGTVLSGYPETGLLHRIYQDSQACIDGHAAVCPVSLCNTAGSQLFQINVVLYMHFDIYALTTSAGYGTKKMS